MNDEGDVGGDTETEIVLQHIGYTFSHVIYWSQTPVFFEKQNEKIALTREIAMEEYPFGVFIKNI